MTSAERIDLVVVLIALAIAAVGAIHEIARQLPGAA